MADVHDGIKARGIKLFGTTISLHTHNHKIPETTTDKDSTKTLSDSKALENLQKTNIDQDSARSLSESKTLEKRDQDSTKSSSDSKVLEKRPKITTDQDSTKSSSESEALDNKRPDKIVPCPRCKSIETKFCYFNNYNVNQPRHFCRACQRYWTAGGALRDVPVGAGRRKNKPPCLSSGDGQQFHFDDVAAEEWAVVYGGFEHVPAKRRGSIPGGHSC